MHYTEIGDLEPERLKGWGDATNRLASSSLPMRCEVRSRGAAGFGTSVVR
jgi:hypothetical protein